MYIICIYTVQRITICILLLINSKRIGKNIVFLHYRRCESKEEMETLYTGAIHGFPQSNGGLTNGISTGMGSSFDQDGVLSLIVVLGGSLSLVALVFAFITYRQVESNPFSHDKLEIRDEIQIFFSNVQDEMLKQSKYLKKNLVAIQRR